MYYLMVGSKLKTDLSLEGKVSPINPRSLSYLSAFCARETVQISTDDLNKLLVECQSSNLEPKAEALTLELMLEEE